MDEKKFFMSLRKVVPSDLEYYLEQQASNGKMLKPVGESGFLFYEFYDAAPTKCKYVVDVSALPKALYIETLINDNWEYLGRTLNCYVWRKCYEQERPNDFSDKECKRKHCLRMGLGFAVAALVCLILLFALIWGCMFEHRNGINSHIMMYVIEAIIQIPFVSYFAWAAKRLLVNGKSK